MKKQFNTYKYFTIILLTIFISGCATNFGKGNENRQVREDLVGYWYGKVSLDGGTIHHWIANHQADGQLYLEFKGVKDTIIVYRSSEEGFWTSDDHQFTSQVKVRYTEDGIRNEVNELYPYKIIDIKPNKIVYTNPEYTFEAIRVDADFTF